MLNRGFVIKDGILERYRGWRRKIIIPKEVRIIGGWAFYENESLSQVIIPYGVNEIGYGAFRSCPNLTHIHIPVSLTKIADTAFFESDKIVILASMGSYAEQYAKENNIPFVAE